MIYDLLPEGYLDRVANAARRAYFGYAPHATPKFADLDDGLKEQWRTEARKIIDEACVHHHVVVRAHLAHEGVDDPEEERRRVLQRVAHFLCEEFGVAVDAS